jgi:hypothetical protein
MADAVYENLSVERHEIRILHLVLDAPGEAIMVMLSTALLGDRPTHSYETIYYVWGDSSVTEPIDGNSNDFGVGAGLASALYQCWL